MDPQTIKAILAIGSIVFIGFFGNLIFVRFRLPDVLILVALGMLIGPDLLGKTFGLVTIDTLNGINNYQDLLLSGALILILFDGGLSLDVKTVIHSMKISTFIILLTLLTEITAVALALYFLMDMDLLLAFVVGAIVGGTGEAVVIPIANRLRVKPETKTMLVMESVITDVCVIVIALTLIQVIALGDFSVLSLVRSLAMKFLFGAAVGFAAGIAWLFVLQKLQNQPLSYMITIGALLLVAGFVELSPMESSAAVAALAFGLAIGNRKFIKRWLTSLTLKLSSDEHIHQFHSEISFFVRTFFYVYLGLMFRFSTFTALHLAIGVGIIGIIVAVRRTTSLIAYKVGDMDKSDAEALFSLMPRGLAAAVLATVPAALLTSTAVWKSEYNPLIINVALTVILGTTILTTILSFFVERNIDKRNRRQLRNQLTESEST